jgi:hypothetical protein
LFGEVLVIDVRCEYAQLRKFASSLGWRTLKQHTKVFSPDDVLVWYETTDRKFWFQINRYGDETSPFYNAAAYSLRHGICVGFFVFDLSRAAISQYMAPLWRRSNFYDPRWRRVVKTLHPTWCVMKPTPKACYRAMRKGIWAPFMRADEERWVEFRDAIVQRYPQCLTGV